MLSVLIPYRAGDAQRDRVFTWTRRRWAGMESRWPEDLEVILSSGPDGEFNRAAARNDAARRAWGDVLMFADADVALEYPAVDTAWRLVSGGAHAWLQPFTTYVNLAEAATDRLLLHDPTTPPREMLFTERDCLHVIDDSPGGCYVVSRDAYETVGGWDEGFRGWGYEDDAFRLTLRTLLGSGHRLPGTCTHLWHEEGLMFQQPFINHNRERYAAYEDAAADPERMRQLCASR